MTESVATRLRRYAVIYRKQALTHGGWSNKRRWVSMPVESPDRAADALRITFQVPVLIEQVLEYTESGGGRGD